MCLKMDSDKRKYPLNDLLHSNIPQYLGILSKPGIQHTAYRATMLTYSHMETTVLHYASLIYKQRTHLTNASLKHGRCTQTSYSESGSIHNFRTPVHPLFCTLVVHRSFRGSREIHKFQCTLARNNTMSLPVHTLQFISPIQIKRTHTTLHDLYTINTYHTTHVDIYEYLSFQTIKCKQPDHSIHTNPGRLRARQCGTIDCNIRAQKASSCSQIFSQLPAACTAHLKPLIMGHIPTQNQQRYIKKTIAYLAFLLTMYLELHASSHMRLK